MPKSRLEAFSDGVIAIIITIMVLDLKVPHGFELAALRPLMPVFVSYLLSFVIVGIYWNNHHHLLHAAKHVNGRILWANLHLLFWLSLFPFTTGWMGENAFHTAAVALYGVVLLFAAIAFYRLGVALRAQQGANSPLADALGSSRKEKRSIALYAVGIALSFVHPWLGIAVYVGVNAMWFVPDRRIEKRLGS